MTEYIGRSPDGSGSREPSPPVSAVPASIPNAVPFNLNNYVWVRLTDDGRKAMRDQHRSVLGRIADLYPYIPPKEKDGWSKWQLHDLMSTFGPNMGMARPLMFYTNILVDLCNEPCLESARMFGAAPDMFMALRRLVEVIDMAGLFNLSNGVQLGQTAWYIKASDAKAAAEEAIARASGIEARSDETRSGSAEGESPVAKPDAQGQPS